MKSVVKTALAPDLSLPEFATPMMQQYLRVKAEYPECLLWFRLGDFYEMFLEDARVGSQVLGIVLTSRTRGKDGRIPMAGIPYHAADSYLHKLLTAGYKVAICEQLTLPNGRGLVEREVVRVVTPGTVLDEQNLIQKEHNYVCSLQLSKKAIGLAVADLSTGQFLAAEFVLTSAQPAESWLQRLFENYHPKECVVAAETRDLPLITQLLKTYPDLSLSVGQHWPTNDEGALKTLRKYFSPAQLATAQLTHAPQAQIAAAGLYQYLEYTQKTELPHVTNIQELTFSQYLQLDHSTIANLELVKNLQTGHVRGSLLYVLDHTVTAMGGRLLRDWVLRPLVDLTAIRARLDSLEFLLAQTPLRQQLHDHLCQIIDLERLLSRLSTKQGNPKDLRALISSVQVISALQTILAATPNILSQLQMTIPVAVTKLIAQLDSQLVEDPPFDPRQGGLLKPGQYPKLDSLRTKITTSQTWITQLELQERSRTNIQSLKIKFNQIFGYYIEVSHAHQQKVPPEYQRKQTLVNAERFTTPELKHHERLILAAQEQAHKIEYEYFLEMVAAVLKEVAPIQALAARIAELDCLASLSEVAKLHNYVRPKLTEGEELSITAGRHPVIEHVLGQAKFIPNDVVISSNINQLLIITGPNMAGKSVLMRQVALITILAHIGSYVPADAAIIPLTDQIFVRSGAADMIASGLSTFMVEMVETAYILQHATPRSLIIMDEIGRGTSTYDGISIAWAVAEYLVKGQSPACDPQQLGPKTLFATHYHELQALAHECPGKIANFHMAMTEQDGKPVFLYQLQPGGASHSFGIAVAELAGVDQKVVERAEKMLKELEGGKKQAEKRTISQSTKTVDHPVLEKLQQLNVEEVTPLEALNILHDLKKTNL